MHMKECTDDHPHHPTCWNAIISGALVSVGLSALFYFLTLGIGLVAIQKTFEGNEILLFSGLIWSVIGFFMVFFVGGTITAMLSHHVCHDACNASLNGFLAWVIAMIIGILLMTQVHEAAHRNVYMQPEHMAMMVPPAPAAEAEPAALAQAAVSSAKKHGAPHEMHAMHPPLPKPVQQRIEKFGMAALSGFLVLLAAAFGSTFGCYYIIQRDRFACCGTPKPPATRRKSK